MIEGAIATPNAPKTLTAVNIANITTHLKLRVIIIINPSLLTNTRSLCPTGKSRRPPSLRYSLRSKICRYSRMSAHLLLFAALFFSLVGVPLSM
jgi:hypothetical protein